MDESRNLLLGLMTAEIRFVSKSLRVNMLRCAFYAFCKTKTGTRATHLNASNQDQLRQMTQNIYENNEHSFQFYLHAFIFRRFIFWINKEHMIAFNSVFFFL